MPRIARQNKEEKYIWKPRKNLKTRLRNFARRSRFEVSVELSVNDIFNWLTDCQNPAALRYLGKYALRCAEGLENPDDDDFRSRA